MKTSFRKIKLLIVSLFLIPRRLQCSLKSKAYNIIHILIGQGSLNLFFNFIGTRGNTPVSHLVCLISFRSHFPRVDLYKNCDFFTLRRRLCLVLEENLTHDPYLIFIGRFFHNSDCTKHFVYVLYKN